MNGFLLIIFVHIFFVSWIYQTTNACSCFPTHPQNIVCSNGFVMVAQILSRQKAPGSSPFPAGEIEYTVRVVIPVKNSPSHGSTFKFTTADNSAACGVSYTIGSVQLLMGNNKRIGICDGLFAKSLPQLSYIFSRKKDTSYLKNCDCKIDDGGVSPKLSAKQTCKAPSNQNTKACYANQGLCVKVGRGRRSGCVWKNIKGCDVPTVGTPARR